MLFPHSREVNRRNSEVLKRRRSEGVGRYHDVEEVREIWRSEVVKGLEGKN